MRNWLVQARRLKCPIINCLLAGDSRELMLWFPSEPGGPRTRRASVPTESKGRRRRWTMSQLKAVRQKESSLTQPFLSKRLF